MLLRDLAIRPTRCFPAGGPDVYHGIKIDYRGQDVNAATFLAVLAGNKTAVQGKGTGKVGAASVLLDKYHTCIVPVVVDSLMLSAVSQLLTGPT